MFSDRVTPPMNSQKPGRATGQSAVVVDMSKITPAAPPCITSSSLSVRDQMAQCSSLRTVKIGEVGYDGHFVGN